MAALQQSVVRRSIGGLLLLAMFIWGALAVGRSEEVQTCEKEAYAHHRVAEGPGMFGLHVVSWPCFRRYAEVNEKPLVVAATVGLFVVTALLTFFTYRLWAATIRLATEAKGSADATLRHLEDTAERQLRAYVAVRETRMPKTDKPPIRVPQLEIIIENSGQTPAHGVSVAYEWQVRDRPLTAPLPIITDDKFDTGKVINPDGSLRLQINTAKVLPDEWEPVMVNFTKVVYYYGAIIYRDVFEKMHRTNFRLYWHGDMERPAADREGNNAD